MIRTVAATLSLMLGVLCCGMVVGDARADPRSVPGCPQSLVGSAGRTDADGRSCSRLLRRATPDETSDEAARDNRELGAGDRAAPQAAKPESSFIGLPGLSTSGSGLPGSRAWRGPGYAPTD